MKQKNLAEEYATARLQGRLSGNEVSFSGNKVFTEEDIEDAFNAGRESVVDSMPELEWEKCVGGFINKDQFRNWYIEINEYAKQKYTLVIHGDIPRCFITLKEAKQAANEHYKKQIRQVLGL